MIFLVVLHFVLLASFKPWLCVDNWQLDSEQVCAFAVWAAHYGKVYNGDEAQRKAIHTANIEYINQNNEGFLRSSARWLTPGALMALVA